MKSLIVAALLLPLAAPALHARQTAAAPAPAPSAPASSAPAPSAPAPSAPAPSSAAISVLLGSARLASNHGHIDQARVAIGRALLAEPDNADALVLQAQIESTSGSSQAASGALARLRQAHPDDPRIAAVGQALVVGQINPGALAEARRLAQENHPAEAVRAYQRLFNGQTPPDSLANEYYQTLSGAQGGYDAARAGLAQSVARDPNPDSQLAYAKLLTYRDGTRQDGISQLAAMAGNSAIGAQAEAAWRQALQWLPTNASSIPIMQTYLAKHPTDAAVQQRLTLAQNPPKGPVDLAGQDRSSGFTALNAGRMAEAEQAFKSALARNPNDPDAIGGLGIVRLRQGRGAEARAALQKAIELDPAHRDRWQTALSGASTADAFGAARSLMQRGDYSAAARTLRPLVAQGTGGVGAQQMLADAQRQAGDTASAEATYRQVLGRQPDNSGALMALAGMLSKQGRVNEANELLDRAAAQGGSRAVGQIRAQQLSQQAQAVTDPQTRLALYRSAVDADPANPWNRLELARVLIKTGQAAEARQVMDGVAAGLRPSADALQASLIFADETNDARGALALMARLPARARSADILALRSRLQLRAEIAEAVSLPSRSAARERLLMLAASPDRDGSSAAAVAKAFHDMNDRADARQAITTAMAVNRAPTPAARLAYAGALLAAGAGAEATTVLSGIDASVSLTPDQQTALDSLRAGFAVQQSDALNGAGRTADAYDQLAPALAHAPEDPSLNLALGRLYQSAAKPGAALNIARALLQRDPANVDARRSAVQAAIQTGNMAYADQLVQEGLRLTPDEPGIWLAAADIAQARGNNARALNDLKRARELRSQQIVGTDVPASGSIGVYQLAQAPPVANPFRDGPAMAETDSPIGTESVPSVLQPTVAPQAVIPADTMTHDIDTQIAALREQVAPNAQASVFLRNRSGSSGLDQLTEMATPLDASFSPGGQGRISIQARPTFLSSGSVGAGYVDQQRFGTAALGGPAIGTQDASGLGLDVKYARQAFNADIGATPLGFRTTNLIGGVEIAPEISPGWRVRVVGERRAVTDSLLSYAGTKDPRTGETFGGVTTTRGHAQIEYTQGPGSLYAGGGYDRLTGQNVVSNSEVELGAGGSYSLFKTPTQEVRAGLDLVYFAYNKNLRFFTLGQGGYFSPQSYMAALIPVSYHEQDGNFGWTVGGAVGYENYHEDASNVFPGDAGLQSQLNSLASGNPLVATAYPSRSQSGLTGNARVSADYRVSTNLSLGGYIGVSKAGQWTEAAGSLFARYVFSP